MAAKAFRVWLVIGGCAALAFACKGSAVAQSTLLVPPSKANPPAAQPAAVTRPPPAPLPTASTQATSTAAAVSAVPRVASADSAASRQSASTVAADTRPRLKVSKGAGILPNEHGQVWREYDISTYTLRVANVPRPEQAVVDWILRETGTEIWFAEPLGILSANATTLRVYHTPEIQQRVQSIVERLVSVGGDTRPLGLRLMTVGSPNWRARAVALVKPVEVKSPGIEAWVLSRENAALLYDQLKTRGDFREHSAPKVEIANGQSQSLSRTQPRKYSRSIQLKQAYPFYDLIPGQIDEGYSLEISPLLSLDGQTMEAAVECHVDQVEKLVPLAIDVPIGAQSQRVQIQVPQVASWRLSERFRWPANEVLLLSCGVVANPAPGAGSSMLSFLAPLGATSGRADALLMIEQRPPEGSLAAATAKPATEAAIPVLK